MMINKEQENNKQETKKDNFKIVVPQELSELRQKSIENRDMLLSLNELVVHRMLDGAKLSNHKHLKTWPGVIEENGNRTKLTVIYNSDVMTGDEAENYIYNKDFASNDVIIVNRRAVSNFK